MKKFKTGSFIILTALVALFIITQVLRINNAETSQLESPVLCSPELAASSSVSLSDWLQKTPHDLKQGMALAKSRGERMGALIRTHPEQALREALTWSEWTQLPDEIKAYVEQPFSALANVEVIIACGDAVSETAIVTELPGAVRMETFVYGRRNGVGSKHGIPVQGIRIGSVGALWAEIFQVLNAADEVAALSLYPIAIADPGGDSVATLAGGKLFYFKDTDALNEANTRLAALEDLPGPNSGAQALFQEEEDGSAYSGEIDFAALEEIAVAAAMAWTGTARDMYVILVDFSDAPGQPTDPSALSNSINTAISEQIWDMSYEKTHIVGTVNPKTYQMADISTSYVDAGSPYPNTYRMHSNATALVEADGIDLSSYETICVFFADIPGVSYSGLANINGPKMWINGTTSIKTITHELGHNYGARHADTWDPTNGNPVDPAGSEIGYGDFTDIMGSGTLPSGHFNAWHKRHISWFDAENWTSVTNSATYRVYRSDHRETTGVLRGLEIQKGGGDQYWVGLRQEQTAYETFSRGVYVLWKMSGDNESDLLDMNPNSAGGKQDGGLALGQTYSDTAAAVHITPTLRGGQTPNQWMDVAVNLGAFGGNTAPTASISGPTTGAVQESMLFSVTASDSDGDELAYFWDTGDGWVKPNTPSIAAAWVSGSSVTVSCIVSDMKGGTNKVSQTVTLSSPLDNWSQRTSPTGLNLNDIALGGGRLVAISREDTTLYSDDGSNWTAHTSFDVPSHNIFLEGITYDGSKFIAVGMDYSGGWEQVIYTSTDGTSWTERYDSNSGSGSNISLNDVAVGGGYYVAVGDDGTVVRSIDGVSWSNVTSSTSVDLQSVSYGEGTFVVVGDESTGGSNPHVVLTSTNGSSWTDRSGGTVLPLGNWLFAVEYCSDRFLAGGWDVEILGSINQGISFASSVSGSLDIRAFAYGNGTYFAAGRDLGNSSADINMVSLDGVNWTALTTTSQDNRNAVAYFNGTFITVGDNGSIWQSDVVSAVSGGFAGWQLENSVALGFDRDPLDDADFDGIFNLIEYALGSTASDAGSVPSYSAEADPGSYLRISYERDSAKSDIGYSVERSTNLSSNDWSSAGTVVEESSATNLTVRSAFTIASQTNEFLRLKLDLQ
jgi:hypothetical protein